MSGKSPELVTCNPALLYVKLDRLPKLHTPGIHQTRGQTTYPAGATVGAGLAGQSREGVQHNDNVESDGHELVAEEEPAEAVEPLTDEGLFLQSSCIMVPSVIAVHADSPCTPRPHAA